MASMDAIEGRSARASAKSDGVDSGDGGDDDDVIARGSSMAREMDGRIAWAELWRAGANCRGKMGKTRSAFKVGSKG